MQERSSSNVMAVFKNMLPQLCFVIREGEEKEIEASELVPGDLVHLKMGDKVPADVRILETFGFTIETSALTGESNPIRCTVNSNGKYFKEI